MRHSGTVIARTVGAVSQRRLSVRLQFTALQRADPDRVN